jgi:uncharacterized protein
MPRHPVHFEIPADDTTRGREFWGSLFGWEFQAFPGPFEYHMPRRATTPCRGSPSASTISRIATRP